MAAGGEFTLCLFVVSDEGLQEIAGWHARGQATGSFPPSNAVPGCLLLAKVNLRVAGANQ